MGWCLRLQHCKIINNVIYGSLWCCCIVVRWARLCVDTASEGCLCCHIYSEMIFRSCQSGWICLVGFHFLWFRLDMQWGLRWAGHVARMGEEREVYRVLVGKQEGRRPLGRPSRRWVDNIRSTSRRWDVGIWIGLGWPRIETGRGRL